MLISLLRDAASVIVIAIYLLWFPIFVGIVIIGFIRKLILNRKSFARRVIGLILAILLSIEGVLLILQSFPLQAWDERPIFGVLLLAPILISIYTLYAWPRKPPAA